MIINAAKLREMLYELRVILGRTLNATEERMAEAAAKIEAIFEPSEEAPSAITGVPNVTAVVNAESVESSGADSAESASADTTVTATAQTERLYTLSVT